MAVTKQNTSISFHKPTGVSFLGLMIFVLFLLFAVGLFSLPAWYGWRSYTQLKIADRHLKQVVNLEGTYLYRDEALTMSLKMAAKTHDKVWVERYKELEKRIRPVIDENWGISESSNIAADVILTNLACDNLAELEEKIIYSLDTLNYPYAEIYSRKLTMRIRSRLIIAG